MELSFDVLENLEENAKGPPLAAKRVKQSLAIAALTRSPSALWGLGCQLRMRKHVMYTLGSYKKILGPAGR